MIDYLLWAILNLVFLGTILLKKVKGGASPTLPDLDESRNLFFNRLLHFAPVLSCESKNGGGFVLENRIYFL